MAKSVRSEKEVKIELKTGYPVSPTQKAAWLNFWRKLIAYTKEAR